MPFLAPAKLNLNLRITGKQEDGFHLLQSAVVFLECADEIEIAPAPTLSLNISGPFAAQISNTDNLVLKAAAVLSSTQGAHITLTKNIPVGAGLGGGSADAACALKALNQFWQLHLPDAELLKIAATLGSDIAACIHSTPQWMEGTGNQLTPLSFESPWHVVLAYPHQLLSAKDVYANTSKPYAAAQPMPEFTHENEWLNYFKHEQNDLTPAALILHPPIEALIKRMSELPNAEFARMSGSGSTCFAVFENAADAEYAAKSLQADFPDYWVVATKLL